MPAPTPPLPPGLRATVLAGSTATGIIIGAGVGLVLLALLVLAWHALPPAWARALERLRVPVILLCLVVIPVVAGVLGWMEGRLKLR